MCVGVLVHVCAHACVCGGQRATWVLKLRPFVLSETEFLIGLGLHQLDQASWPAGPTCLCFHLTIDGIARIPHGTWFFTWILGIRGQGLMQVLYWQSHLAAWNLVFHTKVL